LSALSWFRYRTAEFAVALAISASAFYIIDNLQNQRKAGVSASQWFTVNDIFVPDHTSADDPIMTYDRTIKTEFRGFWVTEVQRKVDDGSFILECSGSGINDYEPQDYIPNNQVRWSWFVGNKCQTLPAGEYRLRSSWIMRRMDWPDKQTVAYSNVFRVY
jgi:hypothetical protein